MNFYSAILEKESQKYTDASESSPSPIPHREVQNLSPEHAIRERYYDFLFGQIDHKRESDDLSLYVAEQVKVLLVKPDHLLENLPVLPSSLSQVLPHLKDKNFDTEQLVAMLQKEPVVAAKVIELANSSHYNRSQKPIADLKSAFLMLGVQGLSEGVINGFIHRLIPQSNTYFRYYGKRIWQSSLMTGEITKTLLAKSKHQDMIAEGYLLGLISNLGDIIIYQLLADAFNFVHPDCQPNSALFRDTLKQNAKRFSCILTKHWNFPKLLTNCLALQTQIDSSKQAKANLEKYPLACYLYEARLLTKLKLQLQYSQLSKTEFLQESKKLALSDEGKSIVEAILSEPQSSSAA